MARLIVRRVLRGASVAEAEALWHDLGRRASFVDGFSRPDRAEGDWPHVGSRIVWGAPGTGRERVVEQVVAYEPGELQVAAVEDAETAGTQTVRFAPRDGGCEIVVEFQYRCKREGLAGALADLVLFRRRLRLSLERTLARYAIELAADRELRS
jgi:hypothetical protein